MLYMPSAEKIYPLRIPREEIRKAKDLGIDVPNTLRNSLRREIARKGSTEFPKVI
jgi:post-segregation antitoxin (ccd killing protein)